MSQLPIFEVLDEILSTLEHHNELVLEAPPGAGKTTQVPIALLGSSWLSSKQIVLLEPRRVAARAAAERMASQLGQAVGDSVGYRIRHENKTSAHTKLIVVTEGVLTRWLQQDPSLESVGLVIFDEFHERHLDSDLGLALCLQARALFREEHPLKLLIMSATLDGDRLSKFLGNAPVVKSKGKTYPVEIKYASDSLDTKHPNLALLSEQICQAIQAQQGNILVFLPGASEIERLRSILKTQLKERTAVLALHGSLSLAEQRKAISPINEIEYDRKVILATDIAETSLTIDGIQTVIDGGLTRNPSFDPRSGMSRLTTQRISLASATQRAGRAGRLGPGLAVRMWRKHDELSFDKDIKAEIENADLASFALQLLDWGVSSPSELDLLDQPRAGAFDQALEQLAKFDALKAGSRNQPQLSEHGKKLAKLPAHPRLAQMLLRGAQMNAHELASTLAAVISERNPIPSQGVNLSHRLALLEIETGSELSLKQWKSRIDKQKQQYLRLLPRASEPRDTRSNQHDQIAYLMASAYPDRIARRTSAQSNIYKLANGRQATIRNDDPLINEEWLVVSDIGGKAGHNIDIIYGAVPFNSALFENLLNGLVHENKIVEWDPTRDRITAELQFMVGRLLINTSPLNDISSEERSSVTLKYIIDTDLEVLSWDSEANQLCERVKLIRQYYTKEAWPDFSKDALRNDLEDWLAPYIREAKSTKDIKKLNLKEVLLARLSWDQQKELERLAPQKLSVPSGSKISIDYEQKPPVLAVKLQEMFGCSENPSIINKNVVLSIHLLSPARRPIQVTQDLAGFWQSSYNEVKKEMKGRYPKHPWPDDPTTATATRYTKKKSH